MGNQEFCCLINTNLLTLSLSSKDKCFGYLAFVFIIYRIHKNYFQVDHGAVIRYVSRENLNTSLPSYPALKNIHAEKQGHGTVKLNWTIHPSLLLLFLLLLFSHKYLFQVIFFLINSTSTEWSKNALPPVYLLNIFRVLYAIVLKCCIANFVFICGPLSPAKLLVGFELPGSFFFWMHCFNPLDLLSISLFSSLLVLCKFKVAKSAFSQNKVKIFIFELYLKMNFFD